MRTSKTKENTPEIARITDLIESAFGKARDAFNDNDVEAAAESLSQMWKYQKDRAKKLEKVPPSAPKSPEHYFGAEPLNSEGKPPAPVKSKAIPYSGVAPVLETLPEGIDDTEPV
ncbi:MAG: hypothetical protein IAF58_08390 [Leptolyngbya sp.]|nr:hypothetical protein [Candidatus Melainabacteria bacterium]